MFAIALTKSGFDNTSGYFVPEKLISPFLTTEDAEKFLTEKGWHKFIPAQGEFWTYPIAVDFSNYKEATRWAKIYPLTPPNEM